VPPAFQPTGKGRDLPIGGNLPNNGVDVIDYIHGTRRRHRYAGGGAEARRLDRLAVLVPTLTLPSTLLRMRG
jgi:hypothetical protein